MENKSLQFRDKLYRLESTNHKIFDMGIGAKRIESLLTKKDLSILLNISVRTIDKWVCARTIPFIKVGRTVRFQLKVIENWLRERSSSHGY